MDVQQYLDHPDRVQEEVLLATYMGTSGPKSGDAVDHVNTHVQRVIYGETYPEKLHESTLEDRIDHYLGKENLPADEVAAVQGFKDFLGNKPAAEAAVEATADAEVQQAQEPATAAPAEPQAKASNVFKMPGALPSAFEEDAEPEVAATYDYSADPRRQSEKALASAFLSDSNTSVKFGATAHQTLQKAIDYDAYPEALQKASLQDRLGFYAKTEPRTDAEMKAVKEFREYLVNGKTPQLSGDTLGAGDMNQAPAGAVDMAAKATRQVVTAPFEGLSRFFSGFGERAAARNTSEQIEAATTRMVSEHQQAEERIGAKLNGLSEIVKQMDSTPAGPERDKLVEKFCEQGHDVAKDQRDVSRKQANDSADPNVKSRFKHSENDIEKSAEGTDDRLATMFRQMQDKAAGDDKNVEKLKEEQSKISEMLQRVKEMIQQIFGGFREGKKNTATLGSP